jgi:hypothetical protein
MQRIDNSVADMEILVTITELGRQLGEDPRSLKKRLNSPKAFLLSGAKLINLYPFSAAQTNAAICVNSNPNPVTDAKLL